MAAVRQPVLTPASVAEEEEDYDTRMINARFPKLFDVVDIPHLLSSSTFKYVKHPKATRWQDQSSQKPLSQDEVMTSIFTCARSLGGGSTVTLIGPENLPLASFSHLDTWVHYAWTKLSDEDHPLFPGNASLFYLWTDHLLERWSPKGNKNDIIARERCGFLRGILCFMKKLMANDQVRDEMIRTRYSRSITDPI